MLYQMTLLVIRLTVVVHVPLLGLDQNTAGGAEEAPLVIFTLRFNKGKTV